MYEIVEKTLDVNGLTISYTDTGAPDGRVLFCVHGLLSNGRDYDFLAQHMAARGYRVIAMDLPGRGKSGWFTDRAHYAPHILCAVLFGVDCSCDGWARF